jgi:hypothetical protein
MHVRFFAAQAAGGIDVKGGSSSRLLTGSKVCTADNLYGAHAMVGQGCSEWQLHMTCMCESLAEVGGRRAVIPYST